MIATLEAIYEAGQLKLFQSLGLPEHTRVRVSVETLPDDRERAAWLSEGERRLSEVWNNEADDVYNELLAQ